MEKEYYPIIVLIIASDNSQLYLEQKKESLEYYSKFSDKIKFFYLYCKPEDQSNEYDLCFSGCDESIYPGIFYKTAKAVQFINKFYNYDFLVRTNLSTFWNLNNLISFVETIPKTNYATGHCVLSHGETSGFSHGLSFIGGIAIILTKDIADNLFVNNDPFSDLGYLKMEDDVFIGYLLTKNGYPMSKIKKFTMKHLVDNIYNESIINSMSKDEFDNILLFRIKNSFDRNIDIQYVKLLKKKIYNL